MTIPLQDGNTYDVRTLAAIGAAVIVLAEAILIPVGVFLAVMAIGWILQLLGRLLTWMALSDLKEAGLLDGPPTSSQDER